MAGISNVHCYLGVASIREGCIDTLVARFNYVHI